MVRQAFITEAEYTTIVGGSYSPTAIEIREASEIIVYYLKNKLVSDEWNATNCPDSIKLATAYQLAYMLENDDNSYGTTASFNIGKYSEQKGGSEVGEYAKISPKSRRYCIGSGYMSRVVL